MIKDHYSQIKGAWGFKCKDCGHEYSLGAGGCDACRICANCGKSGGCFNMIWDTNAETKKLQSSYASVLKKMQLRSYSDRELDEEIKRREKEKHEALMRKYDACDHDWQCWSDYYSKGRDCKKCGKQE